MASDTLTVTGRAGESIEYRRKDGIWQRLTPSVLGWYDVTDRHEIALCDALLAARREWVPAREKPTSEGRYLVMVYDSVDIGKFMDPAGNWYMWGDDDWTRCKPTHWMPLPSPPKDNS